MPNDRGRRLSAEEVERLLRRARTDFKASGFLVGSPLHTSQDFQDLGLVAHDDQLEAIGRVLDEISSDHYCGPHPPQHLSSEPKCKGKRMIQFSWTSACFGNASMYVKFCLKDDRFVLLRIHRDAYKRKL